MMICAGSGADCGMSTASANVTSMDVGMPMPMVGSKVQAVWVESPAGSSFTYGLFDFPHGI